MLLAILFGAGVVQGPVAKADPVDPPTGQPQPAARPVTASQAKEAWLSAARQQESYGERVKGAEVTLAAARNKAKIAADHLAVADRAVTALAPQLAAAQRQVDGYQGQLDRFSAASLRGGRIGTLSALFASDNADDFLDRSMAIDQVAGDLSLTLASAGRARDSLQVAQQRAEQARAVAAEAKTDADKSAAAAVLARAEVDHGKVELAKRVTAYQAAYAKLSAADRADPGTNMEEYYAAQAGRERSGVQAFVQGSVDDPTSAAFAARAAKEAPSTKAAIAVLAALSRQGLPYVWATDGPNTFDCSGLTKWAWSQAGVSIPPVSYEQATLRTIPLDQLEPGDLVTYYSPVSHVGMYVGHGKVVHAAIEGIPIKVVDLHAAGPDPTGHRPQY